MFDLVKKKTGRTLLHDAAESGDVKRLRVELRDARLRALIDQTDENGWTPLHLAADNGKTSAVLCLLRANAAVNRKTEPTGFTALHMATSHCDTATIAALLIGGADPDIANHWGETAKEEAGREGKRVEFEAAAEQAAHWRAKNPKAMTLELLCLFEAEVARDAADEPADSLWPTIMFPSCCGR